MRLIVINERCHLATLDGLVDVAASSGGKFGPDIDGLYLQWDAFREWADPLAGGTGETAVPSDAAVGPTVRRPGQVFAIGLNYADHAAESKVAAPETPAVFTKFPACLAGPYDDLRLPSDFVDWEVELVVVMSREAREVSASDAWSYVAGLTLGQDYSERTVQLAGPVPQFSLGKSYAGFGPIGPWLVTPDELDDPDDLSIECSIDGETAQSARTSSLMIGVADLIQFLSAITALRPGDIIFTGTPSGIGAAQVPPRYLRPGNEVVSRIEGLGEMRQRCVPS